MSTDNKTRRSILIALASVFENEKSKYGEDDDNSINSKDGEEIAESYRRCDIMEKRHTGFIIDTTTKEEQTTGRRYDKNLDDFKNRLSNNKLTKRLDREEHTENKPNNIEHEIN